MMTYEVFHPSPIAHCLPFCNLKLETWNVKPERSELVFLFQCTVLWYILWIKSFAILKLAKNFLAK